VAKHKALATCDRRLAQPDAANVSLTRAILDLLQYDDFDMTLAHAILDLLNRPCNMQLAIR